MICPTKDQTRLLIDNADELTKLLKTDSRTNSELIYWIPTYILMWDDKPFSLLGQMLPKMHALAESQDKIRWRKLTKGYISIHVFSIQQYYLAMSSNYLKRRLDKAIYQQNSADYTLTVDTSKYFSSEQKTRITASQKSGRTPQ
jgi:hypothetical protein